MMLRVRICLHTWSLEEREDALKLATGNRGADATTRSHDTSLANELERAWASVALSFRSPSSVLVFA